MWYTAILSAVSCATAAGCAAPGPAAAARPEGLSPAGRVVLIRGQGRVFSGGWGTLAGRLRAAGVWADDVPDRDGGVAERLLSERRAGLWRGPLILVGHSRGGRQALRAAGELAAAGQPTDLLITVDVAWPPPVPPGVRAAINLRLTRGRIYPAAALSPAPGATAAITEIDLDSPDSPVGRVVADHLSVTDDPRLLGWLERTIRARLMSRSTPPGRPGGRGTSRRAPGPSERKNSMRCSGPGPCGGP